MIIAGGTSVAASDNDVVLCRAAGLTKPETFTTANRQDNKNIYEFMVIIAMIKLIDQVDIEEVG